MGKKIYPPFFFGGYSYWLITLVAKWVRTYLMNEWIGGTWIDVLKKKKYFNHVVTNYFEE